MRNVFWLTDFWLTDEQIPPILLAGGLVFAVGNAANAATRRMGGALVTAGAVIVVGQTEAGSVAFRMIFAILILGGLVKALLSLPITTRPRR